MHPCEPENHCDHIIGNLWVGRNPSAYDSSNFKTIFCLDGRPQYNISVGQVVIVQPFDDKEMMPWFNPEELARQVINYMDKGSVLIHCSGGVNRSPFIAGLAMRQLGFTGQQALDLMRENRGEVLLVTNDTFRNSLLEP